MVEQWSAVPEDGRVLEATKRRVSCVPDPELAGQEQVRVVRLAQPEAGLVEVGPPVAELTVSYDDLLGTRSRHWGQRQFSLPALRLAGVTQAHRYTMLSACRGLLGLDMSNQLCKSKVGPCNNSL